MSLASLRTEVGTIKAKRFKPLPQKFEGGTHGSVIFCTDNQLSSEVALKRISNDDIGNGIAVHALREIAAYRKIGLHDNILNILEVINEGPLFFVLEMMEGTLKDLIKQNRLNDAENKRFKKQILKGVDWCHKHKIMHRDIKPHNILIKNGNLKIADFGLAKQYSKYCKRSHSLMAVTLWYRALEILLGFETYTEKIDIWSIGCVFFEMDYKQPMFMSDSEIDTIMKIYLRLGNPTEENFPGVSRLANFNYNISFSATNTLPELDEIYQHIFQYNQSKRPGAAELLQRFFND